jgi:hypothetical protein
MRHAFAVESLATVLVCAIGCGGSRATTDAHAGKPGVSSTRPAAEASICDDYVRMVTQCIETKLPESERAGERQNLVMFRKTLERFPTAATHCAANMRNEIRHDSYGCYADEAEKRGIQTACTLLTRTELEELVGSRLEGGVPGNEKCSYAFAGEPLREPLKIKVRWESARDDIDAARGAQAILNDKLTKVTGTSDFVPGAAVEGVGDDAFFTLAGIWPMLSTRLGDVSIAVEGTDRDKLIAITRLALPRIKPEPKREF